MEKPVNHLIKVWVFTRQSLPMPVTKGECWESVVRLKPHGGAWHRVCLNQGIDSESGSHCHQDWLDDKKLPNCLVPFGDDFVGGDILL